MLNNVLDFPFNIHTEHVFKWVVNFADPEDELEDMGDEMDPIDVSFSMSFFLQALISLFYSAFKQRRIRE